MRRAEFVRQELYVSGALGFEAAGSINAEHIDAHWWGVVDLLLTREQVRYERRIRLLFGLLDHALDYPAWNVTPATPPRARQFLELRAQALNNAPRWHELLVPLLEDLRADSLLSGADFTRLRDRLLACKP